MQRYRIIGLMSGTSLDGLDIAYCQLTYNKEQWGYAITHAETISYSDKWNDALKTAHLKSTAQLLQLHHEYGHYLGNEVKKFVRRHKISQVDFVSSHGHTIFHQPDKGFTFQLGAGSSIAASAKLPVICDFRSSDVALGGQGAPLVPVGDQLLFGDYAQCLNLGGFANISYQKRGRRIAFDIAPVNIVFNALVAQKGKAFDKDGEIARSGKVHIPLLKKLDAINFFKQEPPKSLGREWLEDKYLPILDKYDISMEDKLRTVCQNTAQQIAEVLDNGPKGKVLVTGGGAFNTYFIELILQNTSNTCVVPHTSLVNYKEALVFAFLGALRMRNEVNSLSSVTGASRDNIGGAVHFC